MSGQLFGIEITVPKEGPAIREGFPRWHVQVFNDGDCAITCPKVEKRCGNTAIVHHATWLSMPGLTRPCPYCFYASRIP